MKAIPTPVGHYPAIDAELAIDTESLPAQPNALGGDPVFICSPTVDTLFEGRVILAQPPRGQGYRVNVDALRLAVFAAQGQRGRRARTAFDLGAGVGAVALALLHLEAADRVTLLDVDPVLAKLAEANAAANGWSERMEVRCVDVAHLESLPPGAADLVVCNPPYVEPGRGRMPSPGRARARIGPLAIFVDAARRLAGRRARVCFIYPAIETTSLLIALRARGLEPKRLQTVHASPEEKARVVMVECCAGRPGGLIIEPPLVET